MSPYSGLPARCFWKQAVAPSEPDRVSQLYESKFEIHASDRIATAGSCFAQHLATPLRQHGYQVMDMEPAPPWLDLTTARAHGFGLFSARYGNIYTARQLLQLAREALDAFRPAEPVWERDGRLVDAQRPGVEPDGLDTPDEVMALRAGHLARVREMLGQMDVFVFTLGLTEAWMDRMGSTVYPMAPGTMAGTWRPADYRFHNFSTAEVIQDLRAFRALVQRINPGFRMILTVSPVPLAATARDMHVLAATTGSKAVLRAAAEQIAAEDDTTAYFPSYELIASPFSAARFYQPGLRDVTPEGVAAVMRMFFDQHPPVDGAASIPAGVQDTVCEEEMLRVFGS